jgi:hypothetical protein
MAVMMLQEQGKLDQRDDIRTYCPDYVFSGSRDGAVAGGHRAVCASLCAGGLGTPIPGKKGFALQTGLKTYQDCVATLEGDALLREKVEGALRITV